MIYYELERDNCYMVSKNMYLALLSTLVIFVNVAKIFNTFLRYQDTVADDLHCIIIYLSLLNCG